MLLRPPRVEGWLPRFQVAMGGQVIPVDGPDPARAAQFELVVAASCRKAGAQPLFELGFDRKVGHAADLQEVRRQYEETFRSVSGAGRRVGELAIKEPRVRVAAVYARFCVVLNKSFADVRPWYCGPVPADSDVAAPLRRFLRRWGSLAPPS